MTHLDTLIASLAEQATPKRKPVAPLRLFTVWSVLAVVYIGMLAFPMGIREDLARQFTRPIFWAEMISLLLLCFSSLLSASLLSFPDMAQKKRLTFAPYAAFILFTLVLFVAYLADNPPAPQPEHDMECLLCITILSIPPALWLFVRMRGLASTQAAKAGAMAALTAFSIGAISLRLSEATDSISHLFVWHYAPMAAAILVGIGLGKLLFRW